MSLELKHHHGGISVPDLEASIRWFADVLEFEVEKRFEIAAIPAKVAMLRRGELRVELFEVLGASDLPEERRQSNTDLRTHGNKHLAFAIKDADAAAEVLKARGADVQVGSSQVFVGSDYPFDMGSYDVHGLVGDVPGLSPAEREAILGGNAARLLELGLFAQQM
jgi:methylmalonyl-CoA/ethylmalonyl-CoA epimerase